MPIDKKISEIAEADLMALITTGEREGKAIEYKREINLAGDEEKRKFFASVASFANTRGGDIVFGMVAHDGVPTAIHPLPGFNPDSEPIRLRDLIRAHIDPKVYGFQLQPIPLANGGHALVLRIPRTWVGAHMVTFNSDNRFYARDGSGRRIMDVSEVRMAFSSPETLPERLRRLRLDRLSAIASGDVPVPLTKPQVLVLHVVPVQALEALHECDLETVAKVEEGGNENLKPIPRFSQALTYDLDGILRIAESQNTCDGYTKLFRSGLLEAIGILDNTSCLPGGSETSFHTVLYETQMIGMFPKWMDAMRLARLDPPAFVCLGFIGIAGYVPYLDQQRGFGGMSLRPIRHEPLLLSPSLIESFDLEAGTILLPLFNRLWQACGIPRSINFDENGNYRLPG